MDDEEEILIAIAGELGQFVEYVGGNTFAHSLLDPLKILCAAEDTVVREKVIIQKKNNHETT